MSILKPCKKIAGSNKDTQEISTLVFNDRDDKLVDSYVSLHDRDRNKTLKLSNDGAIISEKNGKTPKPKRLEIPLLYKTVRMNLSRLR